MAKRNKKVNEKKTKQTGAMPSLIFQNINFEEKKEKIEPQEPQILKPHPTPYSSRALMWFGVSMFAFSIVFLWAWSFKIKIDSFNWQDTPEKNIINNTQVQWDKYFNNEQEKIKLENSKAMLKGALNQIIARTVTTTSTVSSTNKE